MPVTLVRSIATDHLNEGPGRNNRAAATDSDGNTLFLTTEYTLSHNLKFHLYKISGASKGTVDLLVTFDPPDSGADGGYTIALFPDNSVAVLVKSADRVKLRYCKVRSSDWNALAWETVNTHSGDFLAESFDMDVSDAGAVYVCWNQSGPDNVHSRIKVRDTGGTWNAVRDAVITDGPQRRSCDAASVVALGTTGGGARNVVFAHGVGKAGVDYGVILYTVTINEATGAIVDGVVQRVALMAGEADATSTGSPVHRNAKLFRGDGNEFILGMLHRTVNKKIGIFKALYDGATWTVINQLQQAALQYTPSGFPTAMSLVHDTVAANSHTMNFYTRATLQTDKDTVYNTIAKISDTGVTFSSHFVYGIPKSNQMTTYSVRNLAGGGNRNLHLSLHEILVQYQGGISSGGGALPAEKVYLVYGDISPATGTSIITTVPVHEGVASSANPDLSVAVDDDQKYAQSRQKVQWQFATDAAFGSGDIVADYTQPDSKLKKVEGTDATGISVVFTDKLPNEFSLTGGTYYMRVRMVDEWGNAGGWTSTRTVFVIHPPVATPVSPSGGVFLNYGTGEVTFQWDVTDPSPTDYQTAYQVQVYTNTGTLIIDTGKDISEETSYTDTIPVGYKNQLLYWIVKPWDTNDTPGAFSPQAFFTLTDPPTAVVTVPANGSTVETGMPNLTVNVGTSGGRTIKTVAFSVTKAGVPVWSGKKTGVWANDADVTIQVPQNYLQNNTNYSVQATVTDSAGLTGISSINTFTVAWIPPDAPTALLVDDDAYPYEVWESEPGGYIYIEWSETADDDFYSWNLYRKDDLIHPDTSAVIEEGEFKLIHRDYEIAGINTFKDYFAPSGYRVTYMLRQQVNLSGQDIESENGPEVMAYPVSDGYWLILDSNVTEDVTVFKFNVNEDTFVEEQEEAEFTVIGRGRVVNKGEDLGPKGSLTSKIRDTADRTARQKRLLLLEAQKTRRKAWLRNPFGDVFRVSVSQMSVARIAGVGRSEFVDVQIPYSKVSSS